MRNESYRFKIGAFECILVQDGTYTYEQPAHVFFSNVPQERLARVLHEHDIDLAQWTEYATPYPSLLIDTGEHKVLVDTGAGGALPGTGELISNLRAEGITPEDIDTVIVTHGHADHLGGNITREGEPAYPNARYVMWADEWEFWTADEPDLSSLPFPEPLIQLLITVAHNNLLPLENRIDLLRLEGEIVPGIQAMAAPGHTPGHMCLVISSGGEELMYTSDVALHPVHMEQIEWYSAVDLVPERALASRRRFLERAAAESALVHGYHFPWPGLGHVCRVGDAFQWRPLE
jgi:glyoxylase-like metal-dependent hydrolase (beta-lactamase superfamily II)